MHLLAELTAVFAGVLIVAALVLAVRVGGEARRTNRELRLFAQLRPALVDLRHSADEVRAAARARHRR